MAPLRNPRHERFVQGLFEGKSADEAYREAGYQPNRHNASRLKTKEHILARLRELQEQAAMASEITVESICNELDEAIGVARAKGQASAMVSASALRAKLGGLLIDKAQVEVSAANPFEDAVDCREILDRVAERVDIETARLLSRAFGLDEYRPVVDGSVRLQRSQRLIEEQRPTNDRKREL